MCPPFVSLLVSALFRWPCSISIHLSPWSVAAGVRPFPLAMQHFYAFVSQVLVRPLPFLCSISISPNSLLLGVLNALKNGRLGAGRSGRVPGRLVSHFFSLVSQFFSFVSQAGCLWSGSRLACLPLPFICFPLLFICLPLPFICLLLLSFVSQFFSFVPGWVLVVGFPAGLSPTSFHLSPTSFHLSPSSFHLSPRLGDCGHLSPTSFQLSPTSFHCLPGWVLVVGFPPFSAGHLVSALFRWPCSISLHLQHFYSLVSQVCHWWCPPFSAGHAAFLFICLPGLSLLVRPFPLTM